MVSSSAQTLWPWDLQCVFKEADKKICAVFYWHSAMNFQPVRTAAHKGLTRKKVERGLAD